MSSTVMAQLDDIRAWLDREPVTEQDKTVLAALIAKADTDCERHWASIVAAYQAGSTSGVERLRDAAAEYERADRALERAIAGLHNAVRDAVASGVRPSVVAQITRVPARTLRRWMEN